MTTIFGSSSSSFLFFPSSPPTFLFSTSFVPRDSTRASFSTSSRCGREKRGNSFIQRKPIDQTHLRPKGITKSWSGIENSILQNLLWDCVKNKITPRLKRALSLSPSLFLPLHVLLRARIHTRTWYIFVFLSFEREWRRREKNSRRIKGRARIESRAGFIFSSVIKKARYLQEASHARP